jgi:hypothetical protein
MKRVKLNTLSAITASLVLLGTTASAGGDIAPAKTEIKDIEVLKVDTPKRQMRGNMTLKYNILPPSVDNIRDLFGEGMFYGRLRANTFYWDWSIETWDNDTLKGLKTNTNMGIGGSFVYKSGVLNGFSFTTSYYGSANPDFARMDKLEVGASKAGKDTFSRYKVLKTGEYGIHTFGENFLEYKGNSFGVVAGRQMFESVFTASNDTKMIPNTFDGVSTSFKVAPKSTARVAWFGAQKLRDHEDSHDVVTFKDESGDNWGNNDDSAVHKGLTYDKFVAAGQDPDHDLIVADFTTKYIDNLKFTLSYLAVPDVVQDIVAEAHYKINFDNKWALRPGIRYFYQMDDGGGDIAGYTNLTGKEAIGYDPSVADSLDSSLLALRLDLLMPDKKGFFRLGYSKVEDKADIFAPWRGFPTGGFTRAMAQYNWYANTETFMIRGVYKFAPDWKVSLRYAIQDFDDEKKYVQADSDVWHLDVWYDVTQRLQVKGRLGIVTADPADTGKFDSSYNEFRLELNYLF